MWQLILPGAVHNFMRCYKQGDVLITPTEYSKSLLLKYEGLENKTIYPVSNGINLEKYKIENADFPGFYKLVDYHEGDKIIVGRVGQESSIKKSTRRNNGGPMGGPM